MDKNKIYFIYMPSPLLSRSPFHGAGGGLFAFYREDKYIENLNRVLIEKNFNWRIERDNTESDIEQLISQNAQLLVCAPGLRFQFYHKGFPKNSVVHLSIMEYIANNIRPVLKKIEEINNKQ